MLLQVLFLKVSLENFLSQQRETQPHSSKLFHGSRAGWEPHTGSDLWMALSAIQSNNAAHRWKPSLSLLSVSEDSLHKGGFVTVPSLSPLSEVQQTSQIYCLKVMQQGF